MLRSDYDLYINGFEEVSECQSVRECPNGVWPDYMLNIWPFITVRICQNGKILPNLVTLTK